MSDYFKNTGADFFKGTSADFFKSTGATGVTVLAPAALMTMAAGARTVEASVVMAPTALMTMAAGSVALAGAGISAPTALMAMAASSVLTGGALVVPAPAALMTMAAGSAAIEIRGVLAPTALMTMAAGSAAVEIRVVLARPALMTMAAGSVAIEIDLSKAQTRYFFVITGAPNGLPDIEIPMVSFQARRRSGENTFLSVVVPSIDYITAAEDRADGKLVIQQGYILGGEVVQREDIIRVDFDGLNFDDGPVKQSMTLTGYKQVTYHPQDVTLTGATYRSMRGGVLRYRLAEPYIFLNPGDVVTIGTDTFTIGLMTYIVSVAQATVELAAA